MKKEDKYYTPTIEEFHIGFEYEQEDINEGGSSLSWYKHIILKGSDIDQLDTAEDQGLGYRVKYLDKEDIESLGFKNIDVRYFKLINPDKLRNITRTEIWISYLGETHYKIIRFDHYKNSGHETVLFSGNIKNKSELKKLLKQLGI